MRFLVPLLAAMVLSSAASAQEWGRVAGPAAGPTQVDRFLLRGLHPGRAGAAARRAGLRGDPPQPQPQLGPSGHARLHQALLRAGARGRPEPSLYRRHRPAARRPDELRPCQPPGRPRCRHLVRAPARRAAGAGRPREPAAALAGPRRRRRHRRPGLLRPARRAPADGRELDRRRPHLRQQMDQAADLQHRHRQPCRGCASWCPGSATTNISMSGCTARPATRNARHRRSYADDDGCGEALDLWFTRPPVRMPPPDAPRAPYRPKLPTACQHVLIAP